MQMRTVKVENPGAYGIIMGQFPFAETMDEIHRSLVKAVPGIRFGLAFHDEPNTNHACFSGTDDTLIELAQRSADSIAAQETFVLFTDHESKPVMRVLKEVPQIRRIYCATSREVEVIISDDGRGRGIMGLLGGYSPGEEREVQVVRKQSFFGRWFGKG